MKKISFVLGLSVSVLLFTSIASAGEVENGIKEAASEMARTASETAKQPAAKDDAKAKPGQRLADKKEYRRLRRELRSTKGKYERLKLARYFAEQTIVTAGNQAFDAKTDAERKKIAEDIEKCNRFLRKTKGQLEEYEKAIPALEAKVKAQKDKIKASKNKDKAKVAEDKPKRDSDDNAFRDAANRAKDAYSTKKGRSARTFADPHIYFPHLGDGTGMVNPAPELPDDTQGQQSSGSACSGE